MEDHLTPSERITNLQETLTKQSSEDGIVKQELQLLGPGLRDPFTDIRLPRE